MRKLFILLLFAAIFAVSCSQQKQAQEYPMFWTWLELACKNRLLNLS